MGISAAFSEVSGSATCPTASPAPTCRSTTFRLIYLQCHSRWRSIIITVPSHIARTMQPVCTPPIAYRRGKRHRSSQDRASKDAGAIASTTCTTDAPRNTATNFHNPLRRYARCLRFSRVSTIHRSSGTSCGSHPSAITSSYPRRQNAENSRTPVADHRRQPPAAHTVAPGARGTEGNDCRHFSTHSPSYRSTHFGYTWGDVHIVDDGYLDRFEKGTPLHVLLECYDSPHIPGSGPLILLTLPRPALECASAARTLLLHSQLNPPPYPSHPLRVRTRGYGRPGGRMATTGARRGLSPA